jgi:uncharacterized membrane protein
MKKYFEHNPGHITLFTLIVLFVFNLILKVSYLGTEPFWYDEIISIKSALLDFGHVKHQSDWDNNPPFYYYCLWIWLKLFGISEFKARLLSVLFSCVSSCIVFLLAKKYFNYLTGLTAALLFAVHNFSYQYTHEARAYSLVVMLALMATYLFLKFISSPNYTLAVLIGLIDFLIIYTHYIAGLVLVFQFIIICFSSKKTLRIFCISILTCILLIILRFTKKQFTLIFFSYDKGAETFWLKTADPGSLKTALVNLFGGELAWMPALLCFISGIIFFLYKRNSVTKEQNLFLLYSIFTGGASIFVLFLLGLFKPLFLDRYLLFTIPFICIISAWFMCNSFAVVIAAIPLVLVLELTVLNLNPPKNMDLKTTADLVKTLKNNTNGLILIQTRDITGLFAYYYDKKLFLNQKDLINNLKKKGVWELENSGELKALNPFSEQTIIFCQSFEKREDNNQIFDIFKQNNYAFVTSHAVKGVRISLLKKIRSI